MRHDTPAWSRPSPNPQPIHDCNSRLQFTTGHDHETYSISDTRSDAAGVVVFAGLCFVIPCLSVWKGSVLLLSPVAFATHRVLRLSDLHGLEVPQSTARGSAHARRYRLPRRMIAWQPFSAAGIEATLRAF